MVMAEYYEWWTPTIPQTQELEKNKFVFVKRNKEHTLYKPNTVLINPHFKENKTVFLNPKFQIAKNESTSRPKVHVNPNILRSISTVSETFIENSSKPNVVNLSILPKKDLRNFNPSDKKIVQAIDYEKNNSQNESHTSVSVLKNSFHTQKSNSYCKINNFDTQKIVHTKTKIVNIPLKRQAGLNATSIIHSKSTPISVDLASQPARRIKLKGEDEILSQNKRKVHTRMKIVNIPENKKENIKFPITETRTDNSVRTNSICTRFKYIRGKESSPGTLTPRKYMFLKNSPNISTINTENSKSTSRNFRIGSLNENTSLGKNSIVTRFKYIRNGAKLMKINKRPMKSKYKIVNNVSTSSPEVKKTKAELNSSAYRKRYVFLNKYNSSSFLANNVILKNSKQRNSINVNGILYKNSPCLLKKNFVFSKNKFGSANSLVSTPKGKVPTRQLVKCSGKYKIVKSQSISPSKLKKSNMTCPIYKKTGKCNGNKNGTCIKIHNPDQIVLCRSFLRGECHKDNCLLSHKVSSEKMPTCKYFLEGLCNKTECQYLHVRISPNADICKDFLEGFCKDGMKCDKRHQFLCPEYEKTRKCSKPKCRYPHGSSKVTKLRTGKRNSRTILPAKTGKTMEQTLDRNAENCQIRYYKENLKNESGEKPSEFCSGEVEETIPKREKLGSLPSFIPIL